APAQRITVQGTGSVEPGNVTNVTNTTAPAPYGPGRINYAPIYTAPTMQWAVPGASFQGSPPAAGYYGPGGYGCAGASPVPTSAPAPAPVVTAETAAPVAALP